MRQTRILTGMLLGGSLALSAAAISQEAAPATVAALSVAVAVPGLDLWPDVIAASGALVARDETIIGVEAGGLRLTAVHVEPGSVVERGDLLAELETADILNEISRLEAVVLSAEAAFDLAVANAERGQGLTRTGTISHQQALEYEIAERRARSDLQAAQATLATSRLTLARTRIVAPEAGVISSRSAEAGAIAPAGQELFRLIRRGQIDWRAELPATRLGALREGTDVEVFLPSGPVAGQVRRIEPVASVTNARVVVHVGLSVSGLPADLRTGLLANGRFIAGRREALHVPEGAVLMRDGFSYLYVLAGTIVERRRVETGRRQDERVEIVSGLEREEQVVQAGGAFLTDGATVRVVVEPPQ
ncbi:efflux RND transporter periplasmic adaptor subunit [Pseudogemmobacter sonorensis]|uniref:efflux RND transporter periplasmic adaptor subunit n=1 Tax=Pseudogemmobacter sonorensis TaxID=2989681 RepID=UPI003696A7FA